jgi:hypothetical protein
MKKLLTLIIIVAAAVYGLGYAKLSEGSAAKLLADMDHLTVTGKGEEVCDLAHDELEMTMNDETGDESAEHISGGREEFCDVVKAASQPLAAMNVNLNSNRDDFTVTRDWKHPWTADYSFHESTTLNIPQVGGRVSTEADVKMQLVFTFKGVKIRKYHAVTTAKEATRT